MRVGGRVSHDAGGGRSGPQIAPLSKQFNRDEEERKLRSDLAELTRKYEKEHEAYLALESKVRRCVNRSA